MREFLQTWIDAFHEHRLLTYATAMAMRAFIGFICLTFLGFALLGAFGDKSVWKKHIATSLEPKVTQPTFDALNAAIQKIYAHNSAGLIAFAAGYAIWQVSGSVRAVMDALNAIIECDDKRSTLRRFTLSIALAIAVIVLIGCAFFVVLVAGQLLGKSGGVVHWLISVLRWPVGAVFLGIAVGLIARYAPVEHRGTRWASVGAALIVVAWLIQSAIYAWFLKHFASYKSATGNLLLLMVVVTYFYVSSVVFLVGAQLDEFLREEAKGREVIGIYELARRVF
jgi:membrane protein